MTLNVVTKCTRAHGHKEFWGVAGFSFRKILPLIVAQKSGKGGRKRKLTKSVSVVNEVQSSYRDTHTAV